LIGWLLERLEKHPHALFSEAELVNRDAAAFEALRSMRLLRRLPIDQDAGMVGTTDGRQLQVLDHDGRLEAFDEDDFEFEPISTDISALARWRVDLARLAEAIRDANLLVGAPSLLTDRLVFVGDRPGATGQAVVLGLFADRATALVHAQSLLRILPDKYVRITVVSPSYVPNPAEEMALNSDGIDVTAWRNGQPFSIADSPPPRTHASVSGNDDPAAFRIGVDGRAVWFLGAEHVVTPRQAQVVQLLYDARTNRTPSLGQDYLLEQIGSPGARLRDLFRGSSLWGTLIVRGGGKGTFRLSI
jgi:hypothetical protein